VRNTRRQACAGATGAGLARLQTSGGALVTNNTETILASLNTHAGRGADGRPYDLEAACRQLKADIIVLQEVWRPDGEPDPVTDIAAALGAEPLWTGLVPEADLRRMGIADEAARGAWGLATLTTVPVTGFEVMDLGRIAGDPIPRAAQLITMELPGRGPLRIVNTHLTYRLLSPVQLLRLVRRLGAGDIPTVIAGDLNMPLPITGLAAGYAPAVIGRSYPAHRPLLQLDPILTSREVTRCGGEVLPPAGSDHLPVRARLRLR
jgi:endonuclease/exonuclease/phosphatase family metal-dependent hydrolase